MKITKYIRHDFPRIISALWNFLISKTGAFLLAVSAIVIGWYQFYINRPILKYMVETTNFISSQNNNAYEVIIKGRKYNDVYLSKITLQNKGAAALSGADVSKIGHNPIRVVIPKDSNILHYTLDKTITTQALTAELKEYNGDVVITFDFLNPDYQIGIAILHQNPKAEFAITGSALNVNQIEREWSNREVKTWAWIIMGLLYFVLIGFYIYNHWHKKYRKNQISK